MKSKTTFSISFFVRKKQKRTNNVLLFTRITVNGRRSDLSLKKHVDLSQWDKVKSRVRGNSPLARRINNYLDQVHLGLFVIYKEAIHKGEVITSQMIKARYLGEDQQDKTLLALIDYHNNELSSTLTWGTLKNYYSTKKYIVKFLTDVLRVSDIRLVQLNYQFLTRFEQFLRTVPPKKGQRKMQNNTVMKHIQRLRKIINVSLKMEWIGKDPFIKFKAKYTRTDRGYLTEDELELIETKKLKIERLEMVRDLFVFSCYTGLAYIDVMQLTPEQVMIGIDGNQWICTSRQKSSTVVRVPLLSKAAQVIEKYKNSLKVSNEGSLLPRISNQKMNAYLKEIAEICKIEKNITFHLARHTFATTVTLSNGVPIETVSKLLGHTKISTTQIYARIIDQKIAKDMDILKTKLAKSSLSSDQKEQVG